MAFWSDSPSDLAKKAVLGDPKALDSLQKIANRGDIEAGILLQWVETTFRSKVEIERNQRKFLKALNPADSIAVLLKRATANDSVSQYLLGREYLSGTFVTKDSATAAHWFSKAAELGEPNAQLVMGQLLDSGEGVPRDHKQAIYWYRKAAVQGMAVAQFNLGCAYESGNGVSQDLPTAASWYQKAAKAGHALAQRNLGLMYISGRGVSADKELAMYWLTQSAQQGHNNAQLTLSYEYLVGEIVPQNLVLAYMWRAIAEASRPNSEGYNLIRIAELLTNAEIAKAKHLTMEWIKSAQSSVT
jgi:TPR repeat protein